MVGDSLLDKAARLAAICPTTPPKTACARSEAFRDSPKPCSYQRAKHVTTSRDAVFFYASPQLLDAAFHYAPSDDYTSDAPPRRRVPLRAAAHSRLTLVNTRQLRGRPSSRAGDVVQAGLFKRLLSMGQRRSEQTFQRHIKTEEM